MTFALRDVMTGWSPARLALARERPLAAASSAFTPPAQAFALTTPSGWTLAGTAYHSTESPRHPAPLIFANAFGATRKLYALRAQRSGSSSAPSLVDLLLARGWDVYTFDYRTRLVGRAVNTSYQFDDLVTEDLGTVVAHVRVQHDTARVWLGGISMGGVVAARFAELQPHLTAGLALLDAPLQWCGVPLWLRILTTCPELLGQLPTRHVHRIARALVPMARHVSNRLRPPWARDENLTVDAHLREVIGELPPELLRAVAAWVHSRYRCGGDAVRARAIQCPVVAMVGSDDVLAGPGNVAPFMQAVGTAPELCRYRVVPGAGHYSLVVGRAAMTRVYRPFVEMLEELA